MIGSRFRRDAKPVAWDKARSALVSVLLAAALLHAGAPMLSAARTAGLMSQTGSSSPPESLLLYFFSNVNPLVGLLLLAAAAAASTVPLGDRVPRLRRFVQWSAMSAAVVAALSITHVLTLPAPTTSNDLDSALQRLVLVVWQPGPALLLSGTAAWTARRVVIQV